MSKFSGSLLDEMQREAERIRTDAHFKIISHPNHIKLSNWSSREDKVQNKFWLWFAELRLWLRSARFLNPGHTQWDYNRWSGLFLLDERWSVWEEGRCWLMLSSAAGLRPNIPEPGLWGQVDPPWLQLFFQAMRRRLRVTRVMSVCFCLSVWGQEYEKLELSF